MKYSVFLHVFNVIYVKFLGYFLNNSYYLIRIYICSILKGTDTYLLINTMGKVGSKAKPILYAHLPIFGSPIKYNYSESLIAYYTR